MTDEARPPAPSEGGAPLRPNPRAPGLRPVVAAQLRARVIKWALGRTFLGLLFLVGAMAHAMGPDPLAPQTGIWIALLLVLSTVHVGLGLRGISRVRHAGARWWLPSTIAFGLAATLMLRLVAAR
ncbi:MAG TPA: hypothetical protein VGF45_13380 [Polyangia bacterium]